MTAQPDLFSAVVDEPTATSARDAGIKRVLENSGDYKEKANRALSRLVPGRTYIGEEIRQVIEPVIGPAHTPHFWGAWINGLVRKGLLVKTGLRRPMKTTKSHGRMTDVYRYVGTP